MSSASYESNLNDRKVIQRCTITGRKTFLVPYRRLHVPKYHEWMKNPKIRELTASEPLSLEEEYAMQRTWVVDENKCTFIILHKDRFSETNDEVESMVGDVNLFLSQSEGLEDGTSLFGELEVMIAEDDFRGQGLGYEASLAMLSYGIYFLNVKKFCVKIGYDNVASQSLFKKFSFKEVSRSDVFKEVTFELEVTEEVERFISESSYLSSVRIEWCWDISDNEDDGSADKKCNL